MNKFLIRLIVFTVSFFVFEKVFYVFIYISPELEKDRRLEYVLHGRINKDLIVFGSSRGARNIIASQIQESLHVSSYNLSYPGSDIEFHEFLLRTLIKHNKKPKVVLLAVDDPYELLPSESIVFRFDRLYPLVKYDYINNEMIRRGEKNFLSRFLALARMNKHNFDIRKKHFSALDTLKECGSMPISFQRKDQKFIFDENGELYSSKKELPNKIFAFKNFQKVCLVNEIKLFIVYSPNFTMPNTAFENRIKELSYSSTSFIHYDTINPVYKDRNYFYDEVHLMTSGAVIFTNEIIENLKTSDIWLNGG